MWLSSANLIRIRNDNNRQADKPDHIIAIKVYDIPSIVLQCPIAKDILHRKERPKYMPTGWHLRTKMCSWE